MSMAVVHVMDKFAGSTLHRAGLAQAILRMERTSMQHEHLQRALAPCRQPIKSAQVKGIHSQAGQSPGAALSCLRGMHQCRQACHLCVAREQAPLHLQGGDRVDGVRPAHVRRRHLRQPDVPHLAGLHHLLRPP